jgi:hypothetical protein
MKLEMFNSYIVEIKNIPIKNGKFTWKWLQAWPCTEEECVNAANEYHTEVKIIESAKEPKLCKSQPTVNPKNIELFQF